MFKVEKLRTLKEIFVNSLQKRAKKQVFEMMSPTWEKDLPCKKVGVPPHFDNSKKTLNVEH